MSFACRLLLLVLTIAAAGVPAKAAIATHIPAETFAAPADVTSASLSPDGTRVAGLTSEKGQTVVFVVDPAAPEKVLKRIHLGKSGLDQLYWAGNKRVIVKVIRPLVVFGFSIEVARLVVVDLAGGVPRLLTEKEPKFLPDDVLHVTPDGRFALVSGLTIGDEGEAVKRFDLDTGAVSLVQPPVRNVWSWYVDGEGVVRGGLARDGLRWSIYYRTRPGKPLAKFTGKFDERDEDIFESVYFSPIGGETVVVSNHSTGRFAVYRLDLQTVRPGALVFENPSGDIDGVLRDAQSGKVIGIRYHDDRWRTHWLDPDFAQAQAKIDRVLRGNENRILDSSRDRNRLLVRSSRPDDPSVYYVLDRRKGTMNSVFAMYPSVPPAGLSPVKSVRYQARDGLTIPAYLTLPKGRPARNLPLILLPHGGPFANDTWDYDAWVQLLANRGYAVLQPQFRGSTGFGRDFARRGDGQWGRKMQDDLDDGLDWAVREGIADPKRVCLAGGSYGGYAAIWGAIRSPERYRCAISWAGVTDLKMMLKYDRGLFVAKRYYQDWRNRVTGTQGRADLDSVSPVKLARQLRVPLLIGHGRKDDRVPVAQAEALVKALAKSGASVETVYYPETGHSFYGTDSMADWLKRVEAFLHKHNPADPPAARPAG